LSPGTPLFCFPAGELRPGEWDSQSVLPIGCAQEAEAQVIVAFVGFVPIAVRRPTVPGGVVPATTTNDPVQSSNFTHRMHL